MRRKTLFFFALSRSRGQKKQIISYPLATVIELIMAFCRKNGGVSQVVGETGSDARLVLR